MNDYRTDLAKYRLEKAKTKLVAAKLLLDEKLYDDSLSRSYYAMFTAARALLATEKMDNSKHSGVISLFNQHFVKTGIVEKQSGRMLMDAKDSREKSDYGDHISIEEDDAKHQYEQAKKFVESIENVIKHRLEL